MQHFSISLEAPLLRLCILCWKVKPPGRTTRMPRPGGDLLGLGLLGLQVIESETWTT